MNNYLKVSMCCSRGASIGILKSDESRCAVGVDSVRTWVFPFDESDRKTVDRARKESKQLLELLSCYARPDHQEPWRVSLWRPSEHFKEYSELIGISRYKKLEEIDV
jgi:hypothetical protein